MLRYHAHLLLQTKDSAASPERQATDNSDECLQFRLNQMSTDMLASVHSESASPPIRAFNQYVTCECGYLAVCVSQCASASQTLPLTHNTVLRAKGLVLGTKKYDSLYG